MKLHLHTVIAAGLLMLSLVPAPAQDKPGAAAPAADPAPKAGGQPKKLDLPPAVETDKRVQSNGPAWGVTQAAITNPALPRVLLIGDSLLNSYRIPAINRLETIANVDAWVNPFFQSEGFNKKLEEVLTKLGPYDVVHFNIGLHGFQSDQTVKGMAEKQPRVPLDQFKPLTKSFVEVIQRICPNAKIIWANTTPITLKEKPSELDPVNNPIIIEHNRLAAEVMAEMNIPINDFYAMSLPHLDWKSDAFHWKSDGQKMQGEACADAVLKALKK